MADNRNGLIFKNGVSLNGLEPELADILSEYGRRGVPIRITSGFSQNGHNPNSRHYRGEAVDITPAPGQNFAQLLDSMRAHPDLIDRFKTAGYKIYDEIGDTGKKWTGAHFHVGRDSKLPIDSWDKLTIKDYNQKSEQLSENANRAYQFFIGKGLTPVAAAGIIGNLMQESSTQLKPTAFNKSEGAFGIAQWRGERREGLNKFAADRENFSTDFQSQLEFVYHELETTHRKALEGLNSATDLEQATTAFNSLYERSADRAGTPGFTNRLNYASMVFNSNVQQPNQSAPVNGGATGGATEGTDQSNSLYLPSYEEFSKLVEGNYGNIFVAQSNNNLASAIRESTDLTTKREQQDQQARQQLAEQQRQQKELMQIIGAVGVPIVQTQKL